MKSCTYSEPCSTLYVVHILSLYLTVSLSLSLPGKMLSVVIVVTTEPVQYAAYTHAIKVTVDGPREPRRKTLRIYMYMYIVHVHTPPLCKIIPLPPPSLSTVSLSLSFSIFLTLIFPSTCIIYMCGPFFVLYCMCGPAWTLHLQCPSHTQYKIYLGVLGG